MKTWIKVPGYAAEDVYYDDKTGRVYARVAPHVDVFASEEQGPQLCTAIISEPFLRSGESAISNDESASFVGADKAKAYIESLEFL